MNEEKSDDEMMMDHVAMECMDAIEKKDKDAFIEALHALIADIVHKMSSPSMDEGKE